MAKTPRDLDTFTTEFRMAARELTETAEKKLVELKEKYAADQVGQSSEHVTRFLMINWASYILEQKLRQQVLRYIDRDPETIFATLGKNGARHGRSVFMRMLKKNGVAGGESPSEQTLRRELAEAKSKQGYSEEVSEAELKLYRTHRREAQNAVLESLGVLRPQVLPFRPVRHFET